MTATYELTDVRHCYGDRCVVDIPTLEIRDGEILGLVGPSGAGKSTLLRLLDFLETPTQGRIRFAGTEIDGDASLATRRDVTTVFQRPMLLKRSVAANVRIGRKLRGLDTKCGNTERWLDRLGLTDLADAPARTLSAGEAQRVALARALVVEPSVLLLDEPSAGLSPANQDLVFERVRGIADAGVSIIMVEQNARRCLQIADRAYVLDQGRNAHTGPGRDLLHDSKVIELYLGTLGRAE